MRKLAAQLSADTGVTVHVEPLDLGRPGAAAELIARLDQQGLAPDILVNNAGFGMNERFTEHSPERLTEMLTLNIVTLTELTHILGRRMLARGAGHILLVASLAAYAPSPMLAAYAASKAYILSLGEALNIEMGPAVGVTVLSPGLMDTGFNAAAGFKTEGKLQRLIRPTAMVARTGVEAMFLGKASVIAGRLNRVLVHVGGLLPRSLVLRSLRRSRTRN
jgi:short-subunit dehydrogenase